MISSPELFKNIQTWPDFAVPLATSILAEIEHLAMLESNWEEHLGQEEANTEDGRRNLDYLDREVDLAGAYAQESEFMHRRFSFKFKNFFATLNSAQKDELVRLPGFFLIFEGAERGRGELLSVVKAVTSFPLGAELFLAAHTPSFDSASSTWIPSLLNPANALYSWARAIDGVLLEKLWRLAMKEVDEEPLSYSDSLNLVSESKSRAFARGRPWDAQQYFLGNPYHRGNIAYRVLNAAVLPTDFADELTFLDRRSDMRGAFPRGMRSRFSLNARARFYAGVHVSEFNEIMIERKIDPKVVWLLLPRWEGSASSLLDAALTLSAEL